MVQYALSEKQILVPSMGSIGKIFSQHLIILRDLKHKVDKLHQSYFEQMDKVRSWDQVEQILTLLNHAGKFLDFPVESYLEKYKLVEGKGGQFVNQKDLSVLQELTDKSRRQNKELKQSKKEAQKSMLSKNLRLEIHQMADQISEVESDQEYDENLKLKIESE